MILSRESCSRAASARPFKMRSLSSLVKLGPSPLIMSRSSGNLPGICAKPSPLILFCKRCFQSLDYTRNRILLVNCSTEGKHKKKIIQLDSTAILHKFTKNIIANDSENRSAQRPHVKSSRREHHFGFGPAREFYIRNSTSKDDIFTNVNLKRLFRTKKAFILAVIGFFLVNL
jgi:hypothetical protein